jgi:hypothetical protein
MDELPRGKVDHFKRLDARLRELSGIHWNRPLPSNIVGTTCNLLSIITYDHHSGISQADGHLPTIEQVDCDLVLGELDGMGCGNKLGGNLVRTPVLVLSSPILEVPP